MDLKPLVNSFDSLILRNIAPSAAFIIIFGAGNLIGASLNAEPWRSDLALWESWNSWFQAFGSGKPSLVTFSAGLSILVGISYVLAMLHSLLIDNLLKGRFERLTIQAKGSEFDKLRNRVITKLNETGRYNFLQTGDSQDTDATKIVPGDYLLYEIVGGIDKGSTKTFVDEAKGTGIVCLSFSITFLYVGLIGMRTSDHYGRLAVISIIAAGFFWYLGLELVRTLYRARAYRLYVNLLGMSNEKIKYILEQSYARKDLLLDPSKAPETSISEPPANSPA